MKNKCVYTGKRTVPRFDLGISTAMSLADDVKEMGDYECPQGSSSSPGLVEPLKHLHNVLEHC